MNNDEEMNFAYLTDKDVKHLMNNNKINNPFILIEASENTKVDYFIPKTIKNISDPTNKFNSPI